MLRILIPYLRVQNLGYHNIDRPKERRKKKQRQLTTIYIERTRSISDFRTRSLRGRELFTYDLHQWHWAKWFAISCFISVCPFVALSKATFAENIGTLFCQVDIKKLSFLTSCVLWFEINHTNIGTVSNGNIAKRLKDGGDKRALVWVGVCWALLFWCVCLTLRVWSVTCHWRYRVGQK